MSRSRPQDIWSQTHEGMMINMVDGQGTSSFDNIADAIESFARGEFVVVLDSTQRENEGDLIISATHFTPEKAAFMIRYTSGLLCAPITAALAAQLELPQMVANNLDPNRTAYTISIDAEGVSTGISAQDRSHTCRTLADPDVSKQMLRSPGHVIPLQARDGGVKMRAGHTEATIDMCLLANLPPVGVLAEIVEDGEEVLGQGKRAGGFGMMRRDGCLAFAKRFGLRCITIEALLVHIQEAATVSSAA